MSSGTNSLVALLLLAVAISTVNANSESDALSSWRMALVDPNNVLQSWDPTLVNPCNWFHVTCNNENSVTRVDLGSAGLSGYIVPQLGYLANLQYLEAFGNDLTGEIPAELGNLTALVSLDLYDNRLSGPIPSTLENLARLKYLRLSNNNLSGILPDSIIQLITYGQLQILDVSRNQLTGTIQTTNQTGLAITTIIQDPKAPKA